MQQINSTESANGEMNQNGYYTSEEEDGDEKWKAAIHSAAAVDYIFYPKNGASKVENSAVDDAIGVRSTQEEKEGSSRGLKLYQTRARKLLNDMLEESLEFVRDSSPASSNHVESSGCGTRLFRRAPLGIVFEMHDACARRPRKRPRLVPREEIKEKSKEFRARIRRAAVDGDVVIAGAKEAARRCLAGYEARDLEAKAVAKREEERVAQLKKLRGEKWLPSVAREMTRKQVKLR